MNQNLVKVNKKKLEVLIDLRYSTSKNFTKEKLQENYKHFIEFLKKEKPENIKGEFIKNIFVTSTMGISYKIGGKN